MTTAIIGVGNLGGTVARHLASGGESVVLSAKDEAHAKALADELGPNASAASVEEAIAGADVVVLATWLEQTRELVPARTGLLEGKVVVDPSNPIGFDENEQMIRTLPEGKSSGSVVASLLPADAHYVKAFGTLGADQLATSAGRGSDRGARRRAPRTDLRSRRSASHDRDQRSEAMSATDTTTLSDYAPIPSAALGPALNEQGYYVGRVERNLYYVTDGTYMSAFLTTSDGVVVLDAPPTLGNNIQRAIGRERAGPECERWLG